MGAVGAEHVVPKAGTAGARAVGAVRGRDEGAAGRRIGRRGLLAGAMALAAMETIGALGRGAAAAEHDDLPTTPGIWIKIVNEWLLAERETPASFQTLADEGAEVRVRFRTTGLPFPLWDWHAGGGKTRSTGASSLQADTIILVIPAGGQKARRFNVENASVYEMRVLAEPDGEDTLLITVFEVVGDRIWQLPT